MKMLILFLNPLEVSTLDIFSFKKQQTDISETRRIIFPTNFLSFNQNLMSESLKSKIDEKHESKILIHFTKYTDKIFE